MIKPRRSEFFLIQGGGCPDSPPSDTAHPLFTMHHATGTAGTPPAFSRLKAQILVAAEMFANEADAARLVPDTTPAGRALLGLLDAVHELQHHETRRGADFEEARLPDGPDVS